MDILAFLMALPTVVIPSSKNDELPTFKPRFWYRFDRLDARPVAWSLRNRPEEWEWSGRDRSYIIHVPSKHIFQTFLGWGSYRLYRASECSCTNTSGRFQRFQQGKLGRAFKWWQRNYGTPPVDAQFAAHFLTPRKTVTIQE